MPIMLKNLKDGKVCYYTCRHSRRNDGCKCKMNVYMKVGASEKTYEIKETHSCMSTKNIGEKRNLNEILDITIEMQDYTKEMGITEMPI